MEKQQRIKHRESHGDLQLMHDTRIAVSNAKSIIIEDLGSEFRGPRKDTNFRPDHTVSRPISF